jgi:hypothetical protein
MSLVSTCSFCGHQAVMQHSGGCWECIDKIYQIRPKPNGAIIVCSSCEQERPVGYKRFGLCIDCVKVIKERERNHRRQMRYDRKHGIIRCGGCHTGPLMKIYRPPKNACRVCRQVKPFIRYRLRVCQSCAEQVAINKQARIQASEKRQEQQRQFAEMVKKSFGSKAKTVTCKISKKEMAKLDRETRETLEAIARAEGKVCLNCGRKGLLADNELKLCAACVELIISKLQPKEIAT